jgi:hypothetical protein
MDHPRHPGTGKSELPPNGMLPHHQNRHLRAKHQWEVACVRAITLLFVNLKWSFAMSPSKASVLAIGAAVLGFTIGVSGLAVADFGMSGPGSQLGMPQYMKADSKAVAELGNNEGVYETKRRTSCTWVSRRPSPLQRCLRKAPMKYLPERSFSATMAKSTLWMQSQPQNNNDPSRVTVQLTADC